METKTTTKTAARHGSHGDENNNKDSSQPTQMSLGVVIVGGAAVSWVVIVAAVKMFWNPKVNIRVREIRLGLVGLCVAWVETIEENQAYPDVG
ncbi:hypothetical protein V6N13_066255 [Hibiscus sabdariffa]